MSAVLHQYSEGPMTLEQFLDYAGGLHGLVETGMLKKVISVSWREGEQAKAELELHHAPEFISIKLEIPKME